MTVTGWTWDYIEEEMTLPRVAKLLEYWGGLPPLLFTVNSYLGVKPKEAEPECRSFEEFMSIAG